MHIGIDARLWSQTGVGRYIRNLVINLSNIDKKNSYVIFVGSIDLENVKEKIVNSKWKIVNIGIYQILPRELTNALASASKDGFILTASRA